MKTTIDTEVLKQVMSAFDYLYKAHRTHWSSPDQNCAQSAIAKLRAALAAQQEPLVATVEWTEYPCEQCGKAIMLSAAPKQE